MRDKPDLQIKYMAASDLKEWPGNAKLHDLDGIRASVKRYGARQPLVVQKSTLRIIAGHGRYEVYKELGIDPMPVMLWDCDNEEAQAYLIADNQLTMASGWDDQQLALLLQELSEGGNLDDLVTGFDDSEITELIDSLGDVDDELLAETPNIAPPSDPITQPGDLIMLGEHMLMCGDMADNGDVMQLMGKQKAALIFTSPPYAVGCDYGDTYEDTLDNLRLLIKALATTWQHTLKTGGYCVTNFGDIIAASGMLKTDEPCEYPMALEYWPVFREAGWLLHTRRIWAKPHARVAAPWTASSNRAASDWEHLWTWKKPGKGLNKRRSDSHLGVWDTSKGEGVELGKDIHPAAFPAVLAKRIIQVYTNQGQAVADPFAGTGTVLMVCEHLGRKSYNMEISPAYCDLIVQRWESQTGKEAIR